MEVVGKTTLRFTEDFLICPRCGEKLQPADLEGFLRCPYCDYFFGSDSRVDDFVVSPLVRNYIGQAHRRFPGA